jgi:hypothetical protein
VYPLAGAVVGMGVTGMILSVVVAVVVAVTVVTMVLKRAGMTVVRCYNSWRDPRLTLTADYTGGGSSSGFRDNTPRRSDFEEYDAGEFETTPRRGTSSSGNTSTNPTTSTRTSTAKSKAASKVPEPAPEPVVNLLDFDDDSTAPGANASVAVNKALPALAPLVGSDNSTPPFPIVEINSCPRHRTCDSWR